MNRVKEIIIDSIKIWFMTFFTVAGALSVFFAFFGIFWALDQLICSST